MDKTNIVTVSAAISTIVAAIYVSATGKTLPPEVLTAGATILTFIFGLFTDKPSFISKD